MILQTAAAGREQVAEGLKLGAYYYLTKPYHRDALVAVVRAALADAAQRRDLARRIEDSRAVMALIERGTFQFRTLEDARVLAAAFAALCEEPDLAGMGLVELLVNAVEHGNLGITFHEKSELLSAGRWEEEVACAPAAAGEPRQDRRAGVSGAKAPASCSQSATAGQALRGSASCRSTKPALSIPMGAASRSPATSRSAPSSTAVAATKSWCRRWRGAQPRPSAPGRPRP